jgi:carboxypeptidase family protein
MRALAAMRWAIALLVVLLSMVQKPALAQSAALIGTIVSDREGPMEGVLVSAKKDGSTITVTVVTNSKGEYSFPASRLEPGQYTLTIRAAGYALDVAPKVNLTHGNI